jgi:transposase, IS5 family
MAWKNIKQRSLNDGMLIQHKALTELDDILKMIKWQNIEKHLVDLHSSKKGERAYPPLMMFKALLLQSWYNLSDQQLESQLARDLLFRRFVGIGLDDAVPDHSSIWRFRQKISEEGRLEYLLDLLNQGLTEAGLYIKKGQVSIIDASVIEAKQSRPNKGVDGENTQDKEAGYNVKQSSDGKMKTTYGFKAHLNVDEDAFITSAITTAGNVHDSQCLEDLLTGAETAVYADSAYASNKHDVLLKEKNIKNGILKRAYRNKPLTKDEKQQNKQLSSIRSTVERVFGILKQHYGMAKARYLGKARNHARLILMSMAYNLKRGLAIQRSCMAGC